MKIKWIVLPYVLLGICIAIGLVIGMAPNLLGDVIPRHGVYCSGVIRMNSDVIFVLTIFAVKQSESKQDLDAILHDPDLQNITAIKKGYVYPIHEMRMISYSSWTYFEME